MLAHLLFVCLFESIVLSIHFELVCKGRDPNSRSFAVWSIEKGRKYITKPT